MGRAHLRRRLRRRVRSAMAEVAAARVAVAACGRSERQADAAATRGRDGDGCAAAPVGRWIGGTDRRGGGAVVAALEVAGGQRQAGCGRLAAGATVASSRKRRLPSVRAADAVGGSCARKRCRSEGIVKEHGGRQAAVEAQAPRARDQAEAGAATTRRARTDRARGGAKPACGSNTRSH